MTAEIITIGDELLIGQVIDTNSAWIAEQLNLIGIRINQITSISDERGHILSTLAEAETRADIILITGGLGPTRDDITKTTLCEFFGTGLVFNEEAFKNVETLFRLRGFTVTELNRQQAEIPANCTPLQNLNGTAPGMWFERDGKIFVSMPGVPFEMKQMVANEVLPRLSKKLNAQFIVHKTILTQGVGESFLAKTIESWEDNLPKNVKLAYLPQPGIVRLRLTAIGTNKVELQNQIEDEVIKLKAIIPDLIFGYNGDTLELVTGKLLKAKLKTISTAESCTGGYLAHLITSIPGSSDYFPGSVVSYSNRVKIDELGVSEKSLEQHGAVSKEVVLQMAAGVRRKIDSDYALAISGIAGPDGGTAKKPVGTTWIALATPEKVIAQQFLFGEHRGRNIRKAALAALNMLRAELLDIKPRNKLSSH
ncbi:MAG: competence/damage-inducible protein A [Bacteroidetes bacterium 4484_276]|nr:MAG: competence/damage-inducible protein A [Bacteroidetes bacterium 4484_276]